MATVSWSFHGINLSGIRMEAVGQKNDRKTHQTLGLHFAADDLTERRWPENERGNGAESPFQRRVVSLNTWRGKSVAEPASTFNF